MARSSRCGWFSTFAILLVAAGCSTSTAPSSVVVLPAALSGIVLDDSGAAIPSASVSMSIESGNSLRTVTDSTGHYLLTFPYSIRHVDVSTAASGFDIDNRTVPLPTPNSTTTTILHRSQILVAGQSTAVTVLPSDSYCDTEADADGLFFACRVVRVQTPPPGALTLAAVPGDQASAARLSYVTPDESIVGVTATGTATFLVPAGTEVDVSLGIPRTSDGGRSFTLRTAIDSPP